MSSKKSGAKLSSDRTGAVKKKTRGRPFASGADGRRNMKGRGSAKPPTSILGEIVDVLIEPVVVIKNGKRKQVPKVRAVLDQLVGKGIQGDQAALRNAATLIRAVAGLAKPAAASGSAEAHSVHDERALQRIIGAFENQVLEADRQKKRRRGGRDD